MRQDDQAREERLAAALRANLRRRKAQARGLPQGTAGSDRGDGSATGETD